MIDFIERIGPVNVAYIKDMDLHVNACDEIKLGLQLRTWLQLLRALERKATGLRRIGVFWSGYEALHNPGKVCLGDNIEFARALLRIRHVEEVSINGCCPSIWPKYLEEEMGARVTEYGRVWAKEDIRQFSKEHIDRERGTYEDLGMLQGSECEKGSEQDMQALQRFRDHLGEEYLFELETFQNGKVCYRRTAK
jgi:hypothetical protein